MIINKVYGVYFSPVKNTANVVKKMAQDLGRELNLPVEVIDFTTPEKRTGSWSFKEDDLVVFGTPTFAGRIPNKILPYVQTLFEGEETLAIPVVTFGNRSFDNSLIEVKNELENHNFKTFVAAAIACEHSFTDKLAKERPDREDIRQLEGFIREVAGLLQDINQKEDIISPVQVPGEHPLTGYYVPLGIDGQPVQFLKAKPKTVEEDCDHCGVCAAACPVAAIDFSDEAKVPGTCIKCQACVKLCHSGAKYFDDEKFLSHVRMLEENYTRRAEPEFFIGNEKREY